MNKIGVAAGAAAAIVLATMGLAQAASSGTTGAGGSRVLNLTARSTQEVVIGAPDGPIGSRFVGADDVFRGSRPVGHDGRDCVAVNVLDDESVVLQCVVTLALDDGLITSQTLATFTENGLEDFEAAITGGTGAYRHARGTVAVDQLSETESRYTVDLR